MSHRKPGRNIVFDDAASRKDDGKALEIMRFKRRLPFEPLTFTHDGAPAVLTGKGNGIVFGDFNGFQHHGKVELVFIQISSNVVAVRRIQIQFHPRVFLEPRRNDFKKNLCGIGFDTPDADQSGKVRLSIEHLPFRAFGNVEHFLSTQQKKITDLRQLNLSLFANKELTAKLPFQLLNLTAQRRLRNMQHFGSARNVADFAYGDKGFELADIHISFLCLICIDSNDYKALDIYNSSFDNPYHRHYFSLGQKERKMTISRRNCMAVFSMIGLSAAGIKSSAAAQTQSGRSIVVYYSRSGNVKAIAEMIARLTGSDTVVIEPETPYPAAYSETTKIVRKQMDEGIVPPVKTPAADFSLYDTIYVGSPTWGGHISRPTERFLADAGFEGKTIRLFTSHGGSGVARTLDDVRRLCPKCNVTKSIAFQGASRATESALKAWIENQ